MSLRRVFCRNTKGHFPSAHSRMVWDVVFEDVLCSGVEYHVKDLDFEPLTGHIYEWDIDAAMGLEPPLGEPDDCLGYCANCDNPSGALYGAAWVCEDCGAMWCKLSWP